MKYIFTVLFLSSLTVFSQEVKKYNIKILKDEKENYRLEKASDSMYVSISNSIIKGFALKENNPDGIYDIYINNKLKSVYTIKNKKFEGSNSIYDDNGNLFRIRFFKNGKRHGLHKLFYETGELQEEINYIDGKTVGVSKTYYKNGNIESKAYHENDRLIKIEEFDNNGNLTSTKEYNK